MFDYLRCSSTDNLYLATELLFSSKVVNSSEILALGKLFNLELYWKSFEIKIKIIIIRYAPKWNFIANNSQELSIFLVANTNTINNNVILSNAKMT